LKSWEEAVFLEGIGMPRLVRSRAEYLAILSKCDEIYHRDRCLPDRVFRLPYDFLRIMDASWFFHVQFLDALAATSGRLDAKELTFLLLDPDATLYEDLGWYAAFTIEAEEGGAGLHQAIHYSPPECPGDILSVVATRFVIFPRLPHWFIWADRDYDAGIVAFREETSGEAFEHAVNKGVENTPGARRIRRNGGRSIMIRADRAIDDLMASAFPDSQVRPAFRETFNRNYVNQPAGE
jgi:hypothetical protein